MIVIALIRRLLNSLFKEPEFAPGSRVNHVPRGILTNTDGYVLAQTSSGVLVEFRGHGPRFISAGELCQIG